jgi:hypothetical protein
MEEDKEMVHMFACSQGIKAKPPYWCKSYFFKIGASNHIGAHFYFRTSLLLVYINGGHL